MKRIFLHIGQPKSGTTALQRTFAAYNDSPANRFIHYPLNGRYGRYQKKAVAHHNLAYELYVPKSFRPNFGGWSDLQAEIDATEKDNVVISSEAFRRFLANAAAGKLRKLFPQYDCKVVLYLRPQWDYIESGYNQLIRFGRYRGNIGSFYEQQGRKLIDYQNIITAWSKAVGQDNIICLPFNKEVKTNGIVKHFISHALNMNVDVPSSETANTKAGLRALSAIRYCSARYKRRTGQEALPTKYIMMLSTLFRNYPGEVNDFSFMTPELRQKIYQESLETNKWLADRFPGFSSPEFLACADLERRDTVTKFPELSKEETELCDSLIRAAARGRLLLRYSNGQRVPEEWWRGKPSILNLKSWKPSLWMFRRS